MTAPVGPSSVITHHVWVIPVTGPSVSDDDVLVVSVVVYGPLHRAPGVLDVVKVPPEVASVDD